MYLSDDLVSRLLSSFGCHSGVGWRVSPAPHRLHMLACRAHLTPHMLIFIIFTCSLLAAVPALVSIRLSRPPVASSETRAGINSALLHYYTPPGSPAAELQLQLQLL
jgi:hypothetical protein